MESETRSEFNKESKVNIIRPYFAKSRGHGTMMFFRTPLPVPQGFSSLPVHTYPRASPFNFKNRVQPQNLPRAYVKPAINSVALS